MILGFFARFFASFLISNWIYSEIVLLYPPFDSFAKTVYRSARIPTHDKWDQLADSRAAEALATEIEGGLVRNSREVGDAFGAFFDSRIRQLWTEGTFSLAGSSTMRSVPGVARAFLSDEDIFARRKIAEIRHATF